MKAVVVKKYRDKETKKIMNVGSEVELSEKRFAEILAAGEYVKKAEEPDTPEKEENPTEQEELAEQEEAAEQQTEPEEEPKKRGGRKGKE